MSMDLGRVQGASIFHTMAASGTSVAISSLQPQGFTPFEGDAVQFSNGDVRQITAVSGSTVTLGDVLFSYKGDPGIGNATLSNVDGDSTEKGATQAAIKGILQAKNYYNLAAFDTYVSNSDGTGAVQRKVRTVKLSNLTYRIGNSYGCSFFITSLPSAKASGLLKFSGTYIGLSSFNSLLTTNYGAVIVSEDDVRIRNDNYADIASFVASLDSIYVQYELDPKFQFEDKVIDNQSIRFLPLDGELWLDNEWRKGLNLYNGNQSIEFSISDARFVDIPLVTITESGQHFLKYDIDTISGQPNTVNGGVGYSRADNPNELGVELGNFNILQGGTFFIPEEAIGRKLIARFVILGTASSGTYRTSNIMLNRGSHPYPFELYYGGIVRENQLPLYTTVDTTSPAEKFGGDWESKGSYTTSDGTTIYVWRKL